MVYPPPLTTRADYARGILRPHTGTPLGEPSREVFIRVTVGRRDGAEQVVVPWVAVVSRPRCLVQLLPNACPRPVDGGLVDPDLCVVVFSVVGLTVYRLCELSGKPCCV